MKKGRKLALLGAWLQLGPVFGIFGSIVSMVRAFNKIKEPEGDRSGSAEALAAEISLALNTTAIGLILALLGLVCLLKALFFDRYRAPWFFLFMVIYSVLSLLSLPLAIYAGHLPIGSVLGVVVLAYIIPRKAEFLCEQVDSINSVTSLRDSTP